VFISISTGEGLAPVAGPSDGLISVFDVSSPFWRVIVDFFKQLFIFNPTNTIHYNNYWINNTAISQSLSISPHSFHKDNDGELGARWKQRRFYMGPLAVQYKCTWACNYLQCNYTVVCTLVSYCSFDPGRAGARANRLSTI
jgi:hypothetical protein